MRTVDDDEDEIFMVMEGWNVMTQLKHAVTYSSMINNNKSQAILGAEPTPNQTCADKKLNQPMTNLTAPY